MRKTAILAAAACASSSALAAPGLGKRYTRSPDQTVTGNELAYDIPSPDSNGGKAWVDAHDRARGLVEQMTLEEKVSRAMPSTCPHSG